jgi:hypothetical protein
VRRVGAAGNAAGGGIPEWNRNVPQVLAGLSPRDRSTDCRARAAGDANATENNAELSV